MNLLPEQKKRSLRREYRIRLAGLGLALAAGAFFIGAVSLLPALFLTAVKKEAFERGVSALEKELTAEKRTTLADLGEAAKKLEVLSRGGEDVALEEFFERVSAARPPGMRLTELALAREADASVLRVRGMAPRRADLAAFVKTLRDGGFSNVSFPVSDLAANENLTFSLVIENPL